MRRALARDATAFRAIMTQNNRRLYRIARSILRDDSEAEDAVQEAYVNAFAHLDSFRGDSSLATWLSRITMNEAFGRLRRERTTVDLETFKGQRTEAEIIQFPQTATCAPQCALEKCLFYRLRAPSRFHTAKTHSRHSPLHFAVMHNASVRPPIC